MLGGTFSTNNSKLTPNTLVKRLKRRLGINSIPIPLDDEDLFDILYEETLPTFSIFFPRYYKKQVNIGELKAAPDTMGLNRMYYFDLDTVKDSNILDIEEVKYATNPLDFYNTPGQYCGSGTAYGMLTDMIVREGEMAMMASSITHWVEEPNKLYIDLAGYVPELSLEFTFLTVHTKDLSSISIRYRDMLLDLFVADVQIALYNEMRRYDKIDTSFGQIELQIDDWADSKSNREEILTKWRESFLSHRRKVIYKS